MIGDSRARRGRHKEEFLKKHRNVANQAFKEAEELHRKGEEIRKSEAVLTFINLARMELKYSPKTYAKDIFWGLARTNFKLLKEKEE